MYSPAFQELEKKLKLIGKYKKIKITFGKFQKIYKINKKSDILFPYFDWLPHPLAIAIKLVGYPNKIKILSEKTIIKKKNNLSKFTYTFIYQTKSYRYSFLK